MRPQNLRLDLSPQSFVQTQASVETTMPTQPSQRPLSRVPTDPLKKIAFVNAEIIPPAFYHDHQSNHRSSFDSLDDDVAVDGQPLSRSGPQYTYAIDKPTSSYAESLAQRSRGNTTNSTPSHSPSRSSNARCSNCGTGRPVHLSPPTSVPASTLAQRASSPPRSKYYLNMRYSFSTDLCDTCAAAERARISRQGREESFISMTAFLEDETRQGRWRRRRGSSSVIGAGDT